MIGILIDNISNENVIDIEGVGDRIIQVSRELVIELFL